jgi:DNA processing protein
MIGVGTTGPVAPFQAAVHPPAPAGDAYAPERDAWTVLAGVDGLGPVAFAALLSRFGSGRAILAAAAEPDGIARLEATPALSLHPDRQGRRPVPGSVAVAIAEAVQGGHRILARLRELGVGVVTVEEAQYPPRLIAIAMPPHVLFFRGSLEAMAHDRAVAVVGTRRATTTGRTTAGRIATALVGSDAAVISGLAYGIDGAAHEAALQAGGATVAVIGGGHAVAVPSGHRRLARAIVDGGGAIASELAPDVQPTHGTFPRRNRIISGLADATVVVEAPIRSGALVTASWALEQGRECYLVPGALDQPASAGCLSFLREFRGACNLVAGIPQLIADLGFAAPPGRGLSSALAGAALADLGRAASQVATSLAQGLTTVDELVAVTDLPVGAVLATLAVLEDRGLVAGAHGRYRPAGPLLGEVVTAAPR